MKRLGPVFIVPLLLLSSCGSNEDFTQVGGGNPPLVGLTGVAAGGEVVALQADTNQIVARANSAGATEPFQLSLPPGYYRFFVLENTNSSSQRNYLLTQGNTSVFGFGSDRQLNLNLGRLDTRSGLAQAETDLLSIPGVSAGGTDTSVPAVLGGAKFGLADLAGVYAFQQLNTNVPNGADPVWQRSTLTISGTGLAVFSNSLDNLGSTADRPSLQLAINDGGVVTASGQPDFHGTFSLDKNLLTATNSAGSQRQLMVIQRKTSGRVQADLAGEYSFNSLQDAGPGGGRGFWKRGTLTFDANGFGFQSDSVFSDGPPFDGFIGVNGLAADGTVTNFPDSSLQAAMSPNLNFLVGTMGTTQPELFALTRKSTGFTSANLAGIWSFHSLKMVRQTAPGETPVWRLGKLRIGADGVSTVSSSISSPPPVSGDQEFGGIVTISNAGVVTTTADPNAFGVMSPDKSQIVMTGGLGTYRNFAILNR